MKTRKTILLVWFASLSCILLSGCTTFKKAIDLTVNLEINGAFIFGILIGCLYIGLDLFDKWKRDLNDEIPLEFFRAIGYLIMGGFWIIVGRGILYDMEVFRVLWSILLGIFITILSIGCILLFVEVCKIIIRGCISIRERKTEKKEQKKLKKGNEHYLGLIELIELHINPKNNKKTLYNLLYTTCTVYNYTARIDYQNQIANQSYEYDSTILGWAMAAIGKCICINLSPIKFKKEIERYQKKAVKKYNEDIEQYNKILKEIKDCETLIGNFQNDLYNNTFSNNKNEINKRKRVEKKKKRIEAKRDKKVKCIQKLTEKLNEGISGYIWKNKCLRPFGLLVNVIADSQNHDKFVRQGAMMGMIDFLMKYKDNEIIKPHFDNLIAARRDMISSDNQMSFFEVRVYDDCSASLYANVLLAVLHCANPSIAYCKTNELIDIAEKEIPGVMELLIQYPLRLIDPGNRALEGFYRFEPYRWDMWQRYTPPLNVGQVHERYHQVLDMTLPNSSGLNIRLFTDPYAAVPVMFHEYNHYMENPNEASVFLKTQLFSLNFYRKYKDAHPEKDSTFIYLSNLLGKDINPEKYEELNALILNNYGEVKSRDKALLEVKADLENKNIYIKNINDGLTWCPEIKVPLLSDSADKTHADMIRKIYIRYAQVPKKITQQEFKNIKKNYMPVNLSFFEEYIREVRWKREKSFKDWCIEKGYIKKYISKEDELFESMQKDVQENFKKYFDLKYKGLNI